MHATIGRIPRIVQLLRVKKEEEEEEGGGGISRLAKSQREENTSTLFRPFVTSSFTIRAKRASYPWHGDIDLSRTSSPTRSYIFHPFSTFLKEKKYSINEINEIRGTGHLRKIDTARPWWIRGDLTQLGLVQLLAKGVVRPWNDHDVFMAVAGATLQHAAVDRSRMEYRR